MSQTIARQVNALQHIALCKVSPALGDMFFQAAALGASPIDRCTSCKLGLKNYRICSTDRALLNAQEEEEYHILKDPIKFNSDSGKLEAKCPFSKDPQVLVDNSKETLDCQISQERRLIKNSTHAMYIEQFKDMVRRQVVSKVSKAQIQTYHGPTNYITHHDIYKHGSASTPVRLVSNSSFRNGSTNLNNIMVKGPNTLADIFENQTKCRSYEVDLVFDGTKAYNSITTGLVERHYMRFWFREDPT